MSRRRVAVASVLLAAGVGVWLQQRSAWIAERRDLDTRLQRTRTLVATGEATAGRLSEFMREVMQLEMDLELLKPVLPTELDIPGFLSRLESCAAPEGVSVRAFESEDPVIRREHTELFVSATLAGSPARVAAVLERLRGGRCKDDAASPLYAPATGAPARLVHVLGDVRRGDETLLGFVLFSTGERSAAPAARATEPASRVWLWPYTAELATSRGPLDVVDRRARELGEIQKKVEAFEAKRTLLAEQRDLRERLRSAEPSAASGRGRLADHHWRAGRLDDAARCYRAALEPAGLERWLGFVRADALYVREPGSLGGQTAYLLALDAPSGVVRRRFALPGFVREFRREPRGIAIDFTSRAGDGTLLFGERGFDQPPALPGQFPHRRAMRAQAASYASWVVDSYYSASPHAPAPARPNERRFGRPPRSLLEIQRGLERIARLDPTNAWHAFHLGAAKHLQGLPREAEAHWQTLFADFPDMPHYEFGAMADVFERLGLRPWADRAYQEALRRRRLLPVPIEATSFAGRLVNAPFLFAVNDPHASDAERRREWLARARELAGIGLPDEDLVARAWEVHFKQRGERALAARERELFDRAQRHPQNPKPSRAGLEAAFCALAAATLGFWLVLAACWRRAGGLGGGLTLLTGEHRAVAAAVSAIVLIAGGLYLYSTSLYLSHQLRSWEEPWGDRPPSPGKPLPLLSAWSGLEQHIDSTLTAYETAPRADREALQARLAAIAAMRMALTATTPIALALLAALPLLSRRGRTTIAAPTANGLDWLGRTAHTVVPGSYDLFRGSLLRGYLAFAAFAYVAVGASFFDVSAPAAGLLEPGMSFNADWARGLLLPDSAAVGRAEHWALVGSLASVRLLWSSFAVAFVACAVLHLTRLPEVRRLRTSAGALPYALPRWLRAGGAALLVLQAAGFVGLLVALKLRPVSERASETMGAPTALTLLVALALTLVWSFAALFVMWRPRPGRLLARERAQLALLLFEAVAVAVFVAWAATT